LVQAEGRGRTKPPTPKKKKGKESGLTNKSHHLSQVVGTKGDRKEKKKKKGTSRHLIGKPKGEGGEWEERGEKSESRRMKGKRELNEWEGQGGKVVQEKDLPRLWSPTQAEGRKRGGRRSLSRTWTEFGKSRKPWRSGRADADPGEKSETLRREEGKKSLGLMSITHTTRKKGTRV